MSVKQEMPVLPKKAANALLDTAKDRLLQELGNKIPVPPLPVPLRIPGIRF
jgi:hypothetical protein